MSKLKAKINKIGPRRSQSIQLPTSDIQHIELMTSSDRNSS